jgi:hypothetical protein
VIAAACEREDDDETDVTHLNLVIDARSEEPDVADGWGDPDSDQGWVEALARALSIFPAQALYEDMRRVERDNDRLDRVGEIVDSFAGSLSDEETARLREQIEEVAGVGGKRHVELDLISPLVLAHETGDNVADLLAGEHLGDFSGFLEEDLRRSDFALGYECALVWARDALPTFDLDEGVVEKSIAAIEDCRRYDWEEVRRGETETGDISLRGRLGLAKMAARALRALR